MPYDYVMASNRKKKKKTIFEKQKFRKYLYLRKKKKVSYPITRAL